MGDAELVVPTIIQKTVDDKHYYFVNDAYYPSVTHILDAAGPVAYGLRNFFLNNTPESAEQIKNETAGFGTLMHDAYQRLLLGDELDLEKDFDMKGKKHIMSFHKWFYEFAPDVKTIMCEHTVASVTNKFAGTLDLAVEKDGELWIIDFKTSSGIYFSHELQIAAYKLAFEEMYKRPVQHIGIMRTGTKHKSGFEFKEVDRNTDDFLQVYKTYLAMNGGKIPDPPEIPDYPKSIKLFNKGGEQNG